MIIRRIVRNKAIKRVAAYARVSTLTEEQEESYETQVQYYTDQINSTDGWELVHVYADPGITGTSAKKRPQFMQMLQDARDGKVDLVLCKSISRFSRNFKEAQEYVHELKANNVEVWFEKEGIHTFDPSSDLIFSTMAVMAQEESRSISENVKWAYRRMAEQGIRHVGSNHMLGYDEENGKLIPNKDAWMVRLMFEEYAAGVAPNMILRHLKEKGAKRLRSAKDFLWSGVLSILQNEAYVGDRHLQKRAPQNFITKKPDANEPYESRYIYGDHEGLVSPAIWDAVQDRLRKNQQARNAGLGIRCTAHFLYGKVFCAECGEPYRRFTAMRASGKYKTWRCRGHAKGSGCQNRHITEDTLLAAIQDQLGWEEMDEWAFSEAVQMVVVKDDHVELVMAQSADENEFTAQTA